MKAHRLLLPLLLASTPAAMAVNLLVNPSFENVTIPSGSTQYGAPVGWTLLHPLSQGSLAGSPWNAASDETVWSSAVYATENATNWDTINDGGWHYTTGAGSNVLSGAIGTVYLGEHANQSVPVTPGTSYTLSGLFAALEKDSTISIPGGTADIYVDGTVVASATEGSGIQALNYTFTPTTGTVTIGVGMDSNPGDESTWAVFDDFSLDETQVPEPSSSMLGMTGFLLLALRRRRK